MLRRCSFALLFALAFALAACQVEPLPDMPQSTASVRDTEATVLQLLSVQPDGTVAFTDEGKAAELLGAIWPAVKADLTSLNQKISSGQVPAFRSASELANYTRIVPSYEKNLDSTGEVILSAAAKDPNNPQCTMKCIEPGTCCCKSLWFLCFGYCECKP